MADLPIPSKSPAPCPVTPPVANASARGAPSADKSAQGDDEPFHAVLAQEVALASRSHVRSGVTDTGADDSPDLKPSVDDTQLPAAVCIPSLPIQLLAGSQMTVSASPGLPGDAQDIHQTTAARAGRAVATDALPGSPEFANAGKLHATSEPEAKRTSALGVLPEEQPRSVPGTPPTIHSSAPAPVTSSHEPATAVNTRVGEPGWDHALGDKLVWMSGQGRQVAQLHLNPPELGPLQITLMLSQGEAKAEFVSAHSLVRDAIEAAMPKLREMLADNGIALGNASVGADSFQNQAQTQQRRESRAYLAPARNSSADSGFTSGGTQFLPNLRGLIDIFA